MANYIHCDRVGCTNATNVHGDKHPDEGWLTIGLREWGTTEENAPEDHLDIEQRGPMAFIMGERHFPAIESELAFCCYDCAVAWFAGRKVVAEAAQGVSA